VKFVDDVSALQDRRQSIVVIY